MVDDDGHPPETLPTDTLPTTAPGPLGGSFRRLWTSSGLSNLADGVLKVVLPLTALRFTDSPLLIAGVTAALGLPWLLCALPAGALADRTDRRRAMLGANLVRGGLVLALASALVLDLGSIWLLYAAAFLIGTTETVYDTSAQSILPQMVHRDRLSRANGRLYAVELTTNQFVGPPLGGALVALSAALALLTPAALWVAAAGVLLLVRGRFRVERTGPSAGMRADIAEGLRFLWSHGLLRSFAAMVGTSNFATSAAFAVLVLYAVGPGSPMGLSEPAFGVLLTATAVGSLLGSFAAEWCERAVGRARSLWLCVPLFALLVGVPGMTVDAWLVGLGFFLGGLGITVWNVITVSLRQRVTPDAMLGRVNSVYRLLAWGTMPLGAAAGGLVAEFLGLRAVFLGMGLLVLALLVPLLRISDATLEAAERGLRH
ncbi:MFS transporter [Nocardiopsis terrae]|uniref:MFS family permease n=1 Tax=Nocardiopsis terrae TaxID=372655 RepID=A0ABR9HHT6_9ACTN|nr:MFS transporter [Nocardiopsis terrae]MBE1458573.1 MFS family permease [Nocardiopsis terrae]GHC79678.1 MFS transporter [Nocardiopsis terrae]